MSRILRFALTLMALLGAHGVATAQVGKDVAEEMIRKSGLWEQLGAVAPQVKAGLADAASRSRSPVAAADMDKLGRAAESAYAPAKLRATALAAVARVMAPSQLAELRAWYDSPRGKAITAAEEAAGTSSRRPEEAMRDGMRVLSAAPPARQAILARISDATRAPEAMANLTINTAVAIQQGVLRSQGQQNGPSSADLRAALVAQKPQMIQAFSRAVLASFAMAYANIGDEDLDRYATFLASKPGMKFNGQCLLAFDRALTEAGRAFGQGIPIARPGSTT
ncbi:MAG: hypothetical protein K8R60_09225 [Burkholderiales bacterium]|nr:hypothetical protein [Burkholderiales bacterium]